jgi:protein-S-isoprenylcysteine O-methyltransferase Ste14
MTLSWLPLILFLVMAVSTGLRLAWLRHEGVHAFAVRWSDDAHGFLNRAFIGLFVALFVFSVAFAVRPDLVHIFGPVEWMVTPFIAWPGAFVAICGALLTILSQFEMGRSWRLGVREGDRSDLVIDGLYSFSRNPIYVGLMTTMVGIFLVVPNAVTFALVVAGWLTVSAQIRLEEEFLVGLHGAEYEAYKARTRRWLPLSLQGVSSIRLSGKP